MRWLFSSPRRAFGILVALAGVILLFAWWGRRPDGGSPYLVVLGIAQDGGHPQIGCRKPCCADAAGEGRGHLVSCVALVDPRSGRRWIFDATPDLPAQLRRLDEVAPVTAASGPRDIGIAGIFLTHAHMGHYTGLMHLGREALGGSEIPVYALPRMRSFLENNGPWDQLVALENVSLRSMNANRVIELGGEITVTPLEVPHRDEYSETAAFLIGSARASALYVPDIDKWERWDRDLAELLKEVDHAFLDATFFSADELPERSLAEIPHPTIQETMQRLASLPESERAKVHFIHLNHSNPALADEGAAREAIREAGMDVAREGAIYPLD